MASLSWNLVNSLSEKKIIELNVNTDKMKKNVELAEWNISIATVSLNMQTLKMI